MSNQVGNQNVGFLTTWLKYVEVRDFAMEGNQIALPVSTIRTFEPQHEKTVFGVSDQVRNKLGCATSEDG